MCEHVTTKYADWSGWVPLPANAGTAGRGPWKELSHRLTETMARSPAFPPPKFHRVLSLPHDTCNLTRIEMLCHYGTHVDAPLHFIDNGPALDEIPLDRFYGGGVQWRIEKEPLGLIDAIDFEKATPAARPGDIVIVDTGWSALVYDHSYHHHPYLTPEAAQWLVDHQIKMLVVDFATPDLPKAKRPENYGFPVHAILLGQGVLVAEHAAPPAELTGSRVEVVFTPLNIAGSDGGPVRGLVRPAD
jgi:arylformamidase